MNYTYSTSTGSMLSYLHQLKPYLISSRASVKDIIGEIYLNGTEATLRRSKLIQLGPTEENEARELIGQSNQSLAKRAGINEAH
jgi:hypothetical protein